MSQVHAAVTFDLWHTLIYLEPDAEETYMRQQRELAVEVLLASDPLRGRRPLGRPAVRKAFDEERQRAVRVADEGRTVTVAEQFDRLARRAGRTARAGTYLELLEQELRRTPFRRAPFAVPALRSLRDRGYHLGVVSNTVGEPGRFLRPVLHRMGFDPFVEESVFSDEHPWTKPAPALFRFALKALGSRPFRAVHVGDGWSDLEGARRAGYRSAILFRGLHQYGPSYRRLFGGRRKENPPAQHTIDRLDRLPALAHKLLPR